MSVLSAKNLIKNYGDGDAIVRALADVTLNVRDGDFLAIMGASGSGKSTLLHLLGGLDRPSSGEITLAYTNLSKLTEKKVTLLRRKKIGFVFQFFNLLSTLTAEENVALPFMIEGLKKRDFSDKVNKILDVVGVSHRKDHKPDEMSGGEQQRVAIARALVGEPSIILADEPTGNLDSKNGSEILKLLRKSCDELNQTIVMVTHDSKAAAFADRVIFLKDGKIVDKLTASKNNNDLILAKLKELEI